MSTSFDAARETEATGARIAALKAERPAKRRHAPRTEPCQERGIEAVPLQLEMEW